MELFKLHGTIDIDNKSANKALDETSNVGQQTESKLSKVFSGVGSFALKAGQVVATGLAVGGAAMGTLTVKAMQLSGELEQNMGGSEAVFKDYAGKMQETAKQAFSNMGLSTSDYLATANKMGALFQGAGFSIKDSMDLSSGAMQRAADVASIMGIDTSAAMEAIAGAAKGNFTMMDNLGVAMNDTTLNAYALEKGINKTTQEMTNQEKIGLAMEMFMDKTAYAAGNYAKENETLAGSLGTAKAALTNFLDGSGSVEDLVSSFSNLANVIVRQLGELAPRLVTGLTGVINQVIPMISPLISQTLPVIIDGAIGLLNGVISALPSILDVLVNTAIPQLLTGIVSILEAIISQLPTLIQSLSSALISLLPLLVESLISLILSLCTYLPQAIQPLIDNLPLILENVITALLSNIPVLVEGLINLVVALIPMIPDLLLILLNVLLSVFPELWTKTILELIPVLLVGLVKLVWELVKAIPPLLLALVEVLFMPFIMLWNTITTLFDQLVSWFTGLWNKMKENPALSGFCTHIENVWNAIKSAISTAIEAIKTVVMFVFDGIKLYFTTIFNIYKTIFTTVWGVIKTAVSTYINAIKTVITFVFNALKVYFTTIFNFYKTIFTTAFNIIKSVVTTVFNAIKTVIMTVFNAVKTYITTVLNFYKTIFTTVWNAIKNTISNVVNGIKSTITNVFNSVKDTVGNIFNSIKEKMSTPIEKARDTIKGIVDKIKGFFSGMNISFPKIKLPHFSVSPSGWEIGDLLKGSIPKLKIDWYAEAMRNPMIMNRPTIFGYDAGTGKLLGGGEAGSEVVSGTSTLMRMIQAAVASQNDALIYYMQRIVDILATYFPQVLDEMNKVPVWDTGVAAATLAPAMNVQLGILKTKEERGR